MWINFTSLNVAVRNTAIVFAVLGSADHALQLSAMFLPKKHGRRLLTKAVKRSSR